jgi:hypothetical protein
MGQIFRSEQRRFKRISQNPAAMAERIMTFAPASDAEALKLLRASFPDCPLSARVAALAFLMQRQESARVHSPK